MATPEQKRAWAVEQISKSKNKGIRIGADGTVEIGGSGEFDPTSSVESQLQKSQIGYDKFKATIGMAREVAAANPNIFGIVGIGRQGVQDAAQIAKSLGDVFGVKDIQGTLAGLQQDAAANGVDTNLFGTKYDPALGQIDSLGKILAYSGASTRNAVGCAAKTSELTELLFAHGMNPNHASWLGITPLHEFARARPVAVDDLNLKPVFSVSQR